MSQYSAPQLSGQEAERIARNPDGLKEDNPPFLRFYETTREDKVASAKQGRAVYLDVVMVDVQSPGDTKTIVPHVVKGWRVEEKIIPVEKEKVVYQDVKQPDGSYQRVEKTVMEQVDESFYEQIPTTPWFDKLEERAHHGQISPAYLDFCKRSFAAWEARREMPLDGTPVLGWNMITHANQRNLIEIGLNTIERVAEMTADAETAFGMGARDVKAKAIAYLKTSDTNIASFEMRRLQDENESLKSVADATSEQLEAANRRLLEAEERMTAFEQKMASLDEKAKSDENKPKKRGRPPKNDTSLDN